MITCYKNLQKLRSFVLRHGDYKNSKHQISRGEETYRGKGVLKKTRHSEERDYPKDREQKKFSTSSKGEGEL